MEDLFKVTNMVGATLIFSCTLRYKPNSFYILLPFYQEMGCNCFCKDLVSLSQKQTKDKRHQALNVVLTFSTKKRNKSP